MTSRDQGSTAGKPSVVNSPSSKQASLPTSGEALPAELPAPRSKNAFRLILALVVLWGIIVAVLWLTTANPVAFSVPQIEQADVIVSGRRPDPGSNHLHVVQVLRGKLPPGDHAVLNLEDLSAADMPAGTDFFVPLSHAQHGLVITMLPRQNPKRPLVYPVTPATEQQLQELLARVGAAPAPR